MAAKKKVEGEGGSWQVLVEELLSRVRLIAEGQEITRQDLGGRLDALDARLSTRMDDLERVVVATRAEGAETRKDVATLRGELVITRDQLVERFDATRVELVERIDSLDQRMDSLEQRIERMDRPGSVH
jgi:hypothetical protein